MTVNDSQWQCRMTLSLLAPRAAASLVDRERVQQLRRRRGEPRVRSHRRLRNRGAEYASKALLAYQSFATLGHSWPIKALL
jgi:hypothetical protein